MKEASVSTGEGLEAAKAKLDTEAAALNPDPSGSTPTAVNAVDKLKARVRLPERAGHRERDRGGAVQEDAESPSALECVVVPASGWSSPASAGRM